jgi:hypothetical protein
MDGELREVKCETALNSIARRYRDAIVSSYRTDWASAFLLSKDSAFDGRAPDWQAFTPIRRSME